MEPYKEEIEDDYNGKNQPGCLTYIEFAIGIAVVGFILARIGCLEPVAVILGLP